MPILPPEVLAHAKRLGTPIETAETIYEAYLERHLPLVLAAEEAPA